MKIRGQVEKSRENSFLIICMRPATKIKILLDVRNSNIRFKFFCEPVINLSSGLVIHVENNSGETSVLYYQFSSSSPVETIGKVINSAFAGNLLTTSQEREH